MVTVVTCAFLYGYTWLRIYIECPEQYPESTSKHNMGRDMIMQSYMPSMLHPPLCFKRDTDMHVVVHVDDLCMGARVGLESLYGSSNNVCDMNDTMVTEGVQEVNRLLRALKRPTGRKEWGASWECHANNLQNLKRCMGFTSAVPPSLLSPRNVFRLRHGTGLDFARSRIARRCLFGCRLCVSSVDVSPYRGHGEGS